ncbi:MAG: PorP/SprF family type IX secretion system membrane protein [Chitinophagales bacterium]|nr:PorP/SprF family type IX secretion system membrane protein [Chitinophagales bacterium]MDW8418822.1 PorP/SprF family type IX secretion system membrane protein [Chitinophagales bacterium]
MRITFTPYRLILSVAFFMSLQHGRAQDLHFSQYYTHASWLNPSLVGNYDGSFRLAAIYRNQWTSALSRYGFQTVGADVDFCMLEGYLRSDKLAVGVGFFNDRSGQAGLSILNANLTVAYHKGIGKNNEHRLSLGLQGAFIQKRVEDPLFGDQFLGHNATPANASAENFTRGFAQGDFNAGLYWRSNIKDKVRIGFGAGAYHLIEPRQSIVFNQGTGEKDKKSVLPRKYNVDFNLEAFLTKNKKVSLSPEFLFMYQQPFMELLPGLSATYYFNTGFRNNNSISAGLRYRYSGLTFGTSDAVIVLTNVEFRNIRLGFAYDVNVSSLSAATNNRGAFELSLAYIGETIKSFKANKSLPSRRF